MREYRVNSLPLTGIEDIVYVSTENGIETRNTWNGTTWTVLASRKPVDAENSVVFKDVASFRNATVLVTS